MSRPSPDTIGPRFVLAELEKSEAHLIAAQRATDDRTIADSIARARKELAPTLKRAKLVLQDVALRTATQPEMFDAPTQEVTNVRD